jgi:hypothetical protein
MADKNEEEIRVKEREEDDNIKSLSETDISTPTASDSDSPSNANDITTSLSEEIHSPISAASSVLESLRSLTWFSWPSQDSHHQPDALDTPTSQAGNL